MRATSILLALLPAALHAQFYPDANATWCLVDQYAWVLPDVNMVMDSDPDTTILGQVYQRIREYRGVYGETSFELWDQHYVRSATDGKGYVFLLDSMTEYLTGDTAALVGDTLNNVLVWNDMSDCYPFDFALYDAIVDSVLTLTNAGVTVRRHYAHTPCYMITPGQFDRHRFFWQAGMGTSAGPFIQIRSGLAPIDLQCAMNGDTPVFGLESDNFQILGLPGGVPCCWPAIDSDGIVDGIKHPRIAVSPNPSSGFFAFSGPVVRGIEVRDIYGKMVAFVPGSQVDLSEHPAGLYIAMLTGSAGRQTVRLVVER